jgi:type VI secretion system secreted protein VgrG
MAITQDGRLLRINTILGKDYLLINKLYAKEEISGLFEIDVELFHDESETQSLELTEIDARQILGQTVNIFIAQEDGTERNLTGMINNFTLVGRSRRFTVYFAKIVPHVWKLTRVHQSRIFQHKTVPDILRLIFKDFDVKYQFQAPYQPRNYCVQYQETDFDFASRLMEEEGIYYYFEHTPEMEKLILRDDYKLPEDCPSKSVIPIHNEDLIQDEPDEKVIQKLHLEYKLQSGKVTVWDQKFELPKKKLEAEHLSVVNSGGNQNLEIYSFPAGYARKYDGIDKGGGERVGDLSNIFQDNKKTAQNRMLAIDVQYKTAQGVSDCSSLTSGCRFELKNHPNGNFNAKYIVLSVTHDAEQSPEYISDETVAKPYKNEFFCIPHGAGQPEFRPELKTVKPRIYGSQTATVVGPAGEEIFTDKYGRVKVQFHWDRDGNYDSDSSCWLRVAQAWAGNRWGMVFIPRVGMEVIVQFLEGDPDQPIIVGAVYNSETMPPYALPDEKTKMTIKSDSSKGGRGFNEIRFEDKKGSEQVFIHAEKNKDERIKNDSLEWIGRDRHLIIKKDQYEKVEKDKHLQVKGDKNEKIDGALSLKVGTDIEEKTGTKYALEAGTEIHLKSGTTLTLETGTSLTLKVGGNFININSAGIFIKGTMVLINSGGAAGSGSGSNPELPKDPLEADKAEPGMRVSPPPPLSPLSRPVLNSPAALVLIQAAQTGVPFCEICARQ